MRETVSARDLTLLVGGMAVGVIGSRLLAPLVAMGSGAVKSRTYGDPFRQLEEDHRYILNKLRSMEEITEGGSTGRRTTLFLSLKRRLAKHALAEEDVVYPLLSNEAQRRDAAKHLYDEHAEIKILLFEIENALMQGESWSQPVRNLREMIERHVREEEEEQFPRLREVLDQPRFRQVASQVHREEALIL